MDIYIYMNNITDGVSIFEIIHQLYNNHISLDLLAYFCREEFVERFSRLFTTYNDYFQRPLELGN